MLFYIFLKIIILAIVLILFRNELKYYLEKPIIYEHTTEEKARLAIHIILAVSVIVEIFLLSYIVL